MLDGASYGRVFKKASRSKDKFFTVLYRENGTRNARLGLAVSKKNCRMAARRNRLKRIVRESFRHNKKALSGFDIVVMNQANTHMEKNKRLFESLITHWSRIGSADDSKTARTEG